MSRETFDCRRSTMARSALFCVTLAIAAPSTIAHAQAPAAQEKAATASLDFDVFRTTIEPIFMRKREKLARCYVCHSQGTPLRLQLLSPGTTTWSEEQSRKNFEAVRRLVVPGNPGASRLLLMPLAAEAGGIAFHPGGKHWASQSDPEWQLMANWVRGVRTVRIIQTNAAGDNVHIIDPATNTVVGEIAGIEVNHGAAVSPDGRRYYFSNEADHTLDVVDGNTLKVTRKVPLSGRPNNITISPDGRRVYVSIREASGGGVDIVDTGMEVRAKLVPVRGGVHNTYVTPDGSAIVAGSIDGRNITVIDSRTEEPAWVLEFDNGVRPIAFERAADGSTGRMFVQITDFHGFAVVDYAQRKEVSRVTLPEIPRAERHLEGLQGSPAHGIVVSPDGRSLWVNSKMNSRVYGYSLPDLKLLGEVRVGDHPDWLTFTPDGKSLYVANAGSNSVSVVDVAARREITRIPVGQVPKRNITAVLP